MKFVHKKERDSLGNEQEDEDDEEETPTIYL